MSKEFMSHESTPAASNPTLSKTDFIIDRMINAAGGGDLSLDELAKCFHQTCQLNEVRKRMSPSRLFDAYYSTMLRFHTRISGERDMDAFLAWMAENQYELDMFDLTTITRARRTGLC